MTGFTHRSGGELNPTAALFSVQLPIKETASYPFPLTLPLDLSVPLSFNHVHNWLHTIVHSLSCFLVVINLE